MCSIELTFDKMTQSSVDRLSGMIPVPDYTLYKPVFYTENATGAKAKAPEKMFRRFFSYWCLKKSHPPL